MRHSASTVVVLAGPAPAEVLTAVGRSMNVVLIRPEHPPADDGDAMQAAAEALRQAGRVTSPYALVPADLSRQPGPGAFEQDAARAVTAWRAGLFEWPDYYLVLATDPAGADDHMPDFHLGPLRAVRPHRVAFVAAAQPAQQAAGVLQALGSLRHGPWWPGLDEVLETARRFYPGSLAEGRPALAAGPDHPSASRV
jgi:hypothetical protein